MCHCVWSIIKTYGYREWVEESGAWMQHISKEPATRLDVITLQEKLDGKLSERKVRGCALIAYSMHVSD